MSVLVDMFVADDNSALRYDQAMEQDTALPVPDGDRLEMKNVLSLQLCQLWDFLRRIPFDVEHMDSFETMFAAEDGARSLERVPPDLVIQLTDANDDDLDEIASRWAATEEMGWEPEETRALIDDLVSLAWRARRSGKSMYLWTAC